MFAASAVCIGLTDPLGLNACSTISEDYTDATSLLVRALPILNASFFRSELRFAAKGQFALRQRLQVSICKLAAVAVSVQPFIKKCLVKKRRNDLFAEFVRVSTDEGQAQACEHRD